MCTVCGCGQPEIEGKPGHSHSHDHAHDHGHAHDHHHHGDQGDIHFGTGLGGTHVPGLSQERIVQIETDILSKNDQLAAVNRSRFEAAGTFVLNLVSSPGAGKTTLLTRVITDLKDQFAMSVIEGDQQTTNDADRIRETGAAAVQVNTGKGCHLDAHMVGHALENLSLDRGGVLFIENVGNLVCPSAFDLGEAHKVVILSVTEGEDKPLKYPDMFAASDVMLLNKIDLLPYLDFDVEKCIDYARRINPEIKLFEVSATSGEGLRDFYDWIGSGRDTVLWTAAE